ncbi:hypothetical protein AcW1_006238 [Taiwanofungus camphoratus]|nr:hypothetical protein AcW1_006238 [Antrodia cinnamomea]
MKAVRAAGRDAADNYSSGIQLSEWEKDGWTYHAKGIWLRPTPSASPLLTLFGSTNLNSRSANLDTELSFLLVTSAPRLRQRLAEEVEGLYTHAHAWRGGERNVRLVSWALASALCGFL